MNDRDVVKGVSFEIDNLIEELDSGSRVGLPFYNMPLYNRETMGLNMGNLYLVAGFSGSGKSSLIRNAMLPSIIEHDEKALMIINEEDLSAVQQNLLVFVANNIYKKPLQKYVLNRGNFTPEIKELLYEFVLSKIVFNKNVLKFSNKDFYDLMRNCYFHSSRKYPSALFSLVASA